MAGPRCEPVAGKAREVPEARGRAEPAQEARDVARRGQSLEQRPVGRTEQREAENLVDENRLGNGAQRGDRLGQDGEEPREESQRPQDGSRHGRPQVASRELLGAHAEDEAGEQEVRRRRTKPEMRDGGRLEGQEGGPTEGDPGRPLAGDERRDEHDGRRAGDEC